MGSESEDDFDKLFEDLDLTSTKLGRTEKAKNELIAKVLQHLGEIDFELSDSESDVLGDAYEYLIGKFASGAGNASEFRVDNRITLWLSDDSLTPAAKVIRQNRQRAITQPRENRSVSRGVGSTQLLCLVRKLTAVGYSIRPVSCSNAKHRLFSYFLAIFRSRSLYRDSISVRDSRQTSPSLGANQRQILSESLGYENRRVNDSGL